MEVDFANVRQVEGILDALAPLKKRIEDMVNLANPPECAKRCLLSNNKIMRLCLLAGLAQSDKRSMGDLDRVSVSKNSSRIFDSFFTFASMGEVFSTILKMRYEGSGVDLCDKPTLSRAIGAEMLRGKSVLENPGTLEDWLSFAPRGGRIGAKIPALRLEIGDWGEEGMSAVLDISSRAVTNTQILVAGATGSGKTNLLAVLIQQMRALSAESAYPVNFLLFDYKGEFSDPANDGWLQYFEVDRSAILDPVQKPLPFTPFKDFRGKTLNEINLYSTEMASALCAIDKATVSARMSNRLSEAIVEAYKRTGGAPITFERMQEQYQAKMEHPDRDDSVTSVLKQLIRNHLFAEEDSLDLVGESLIVKMDAFPKDGPIAKAIVYFIISKLNTIYEKLGKQDVDEENVQIRHFTIIDEAHYMLDFDNRPLRNLIAVGRNKGLSIILATQNMESFKSRHFDFYANAQYPLIMKQQTISDPVIRDLFGANQRELQEIRSAISGLAKGELIIKDQNAFALGIGRKYKKIRVTHLI